MKYTINFGCGIAVLYTPYDCEERFYTLANTCFGIRKSIMDFIILKTEDIPCSDFERLEFNGDVYVWREDGARKMVEPDWAADDEWNTDYCNICCKKNESITKLIKPGHEIINEYHNMRVKDLKHILEQLPDDMAVIIPVIDEEDANHIYGFRHVRTAGILISEGEQDREVLCLNAAADGQDIADQVHLSGRDVGVKEILYSYRSIVTH